MTAARMLYFCKYYHSEHLGMRLLHLLEYCLLLCEIDTDDAGRTQLAQQETVRERDWTNDATGRH